MDEKLLDLLTKLLVSLEATIDEIKAEITDLSDEKDFPWPAEMYMED